MTPLSYEELNNDNPEQIYNIESFVLNLQSWKDVRDDLRVLFQNGQRFKFDEHIRDSLPRTKGIYIFFVEPQFPFQPEVRYLMYVGKVVGSNSFHHRFYEYVSIY